MTTVSEALAIALQHYQVGRCAEAEQICKQVVAAEPNEVSAWHLLGVIALQLRQHKLAVGYLERAVALIPSDAEAHNNLAIAWKSLGQSEKALDHFRRAVQLRPDFTEATFNLGNALLDQGRL